MQTNRRNFLVAAGAGLTAAAAFPAQHLTAQAVAAQTSTRAAKSDVLTDNHTSTTGRPVTPSYAGRDVLPPPGNQQQGFPIRSELKSKRIKYDVPQNQISWAFMKELRENNKTRKIYPIQPYCEVYQRGEGWYELFQENCDGLGDFFMHLIIGPEKAMLIDTGYGLGDTPALVRQLTGGKPLIVVNTHEHPDHAYGHCRFDEIYCHEYLVPYLEKQNAHMWDYLFDDYGQNVWLQFDRKDLPTWKKYKITGVKDGHTWNLGGDHIVELVFTGGHSAGHAAYLDKKNKLLFSGDNLCSDVSSCGSYNIPGPGPHGEQMLQKVFRETTARLVDRINEYDYIVPNHFIPIENNLMPNVLAASDAILANPEAYDYKVEKWNKGGADSTTRYYRYIHGFSVIQYTYKPS